MRKKNRRLLSALCGVCLASTLCLTSVSTWYSKPSALGEALNASVIDNSSKLLEKVTGQYDSDILKSNFNDSVKLKTDEPEEEIEGTISVLVDLGGDGLYDIYDGKEKFSDFVVTPTAQNYAATLKAEQNRFMSALNRSGIDYELRHYYNSVMNAVGLKIDASDYKKLSSVSGVKEVYRSEFYYEPEVDQVLNYTPVYSTGVYDSSNVDYKGDGMVVAVLDTGLDAYHDAFSTMPPEETVAWTKEYVAERMSTPLNSYTLGYTVNDVYYNSKVPYAFDYADDDPDVFPGYSSHGVHVAGIIAGEDEKKIVDAENNHFIGVAPNAQLAIMKVFTNNFNNKSLGGADQLDILRALEDCVNLGVDVINMSLGSTGGFSDFKSDERITEVYNKIEEVGVSLVVAAGNEYSSGFGGGNGTNLAVNPDSGTVGSPGSYKTSFTVASIEGQKSPYIIGNEGGNESIAFLSNSSDGNGNEINFIDSLYKAVGETDKTKSITLNYVVVGGVGKTMDYTSSIKRQLADGRTIALVKRGDISFADKIQFAKDNGAVACVIYNNLSGTIRMSLGELTDPIPACSIGLEAGTALVQNARLRKGTMTFSYGNTAGPFMSEFSSWGPTPSLELKPEITAYGGKILSAVAGGYDEYSGTSMATPNMAGMVALVRQHLKRVEPDLTGAALNARVNQLLMSTTTMVLNNEGNPYSPRKQGAGLGYLENAMNTKGYITVKDSEGQISQKTKIELYDDPARTGKYDLVFTVNNISDGDISYKPNIYNMTESLAVDGKTVAEKAHMLTDTDVAIEVLSGNGSYEGGRLMVKANSSVEVKVRLTLGQEGRAYIEESFKNGMYVEGFVRFEDGKDSADQSICDIGVPYLAFYGDWSDGELFDYTSYEISESENDTSIEPEDKLKASAAATTPLGLYDDIYVIPLGTYIYAMDENDVAITASTEKAAISMFNSKENEYYPDAISELYYVSAGLLRGAKELYTSIVDTSTGELVYENTVYNQRKSYAGGGANVGSPVQFMINPYEWGWNNNTEYELTMQGKIDWKDGTANKDTYKLKFTVDYEAPIITDYRVRYEPYVENKETKYDIFLDVDVYDNQYAMSLMPCYIQDNTIYSITQYPIPINSSKNSTTTVSFEITDYYDTYFKTGKLFLYPVDYAMNHNIYRVGATSAIEYPEKVTFDTSDGKLKLNSVETKGEGDEAYEYNVYNLTLAPNELYKLVQTAVPSTAVPYKLTWTSSSQNVIANEDEIFAIAETKAVALELKAVDRTLAKIRVRVTGETQQEPVLQSLSFKPVINGDRYVQAVEGSLKLRNSMQVQLEVEAKPWYYQGLELIWEESSKGKVLTVDENGLVTTLATGSAFVTATCATNANLKVSVFINVISDFNVRNYTLYNYYGGEECVIPDELNVMYLDYECFKDNTTLKRLTLPKTLTEIPENAFSGCTNLEYVFIPASCVAIKGYAFANCTALKEIDLGEFTNKREGDDDVTVGTLSVGQYGFAGCTSLTTIQNPQRLTGLFRGAFTGCSSLESIDISGLRIAEAELFAGCQKLSQVTMSADTTLGEGMFNKCTSLESITIKAKKVPYMAFKDCTKLSSVTFEGEVISIGGEAFSGCTALTQITLPNNAFDMGDGVFDGCKLLATVTFGANSKINGDIIIPFGDCTSLKEMVVDGGNTYYTAKDGVLYDKDETTLLFAPLLATEFTIPATVTKIGASAFSGKTNLTEFDFSGYEEVGPYAFEGTGLRTATIPATMTAIPEGLFAGAKQLSKVTFEAGSQVTQLGAYSFAQCNMLSEITLPDTIKVLGEGAFIGCSNITALNLSNVEVFGTKALAETKISKVNAPKATTLADGAFSGMNNLAQVKLGAITEMGDSVFVYGYGQTSSGYLFAIGSPSLVSVEFGEGTTVIGSGAFMNESTIDELLTVTLPSTVESIGDYAFAGRSKITTLNLAGVKNIGEYAFANCESLNNLDLTSVETIGAAAFSRTTALKAAEMPAVKQVGASAFENSGIETLVLSSVEVIDSYAFTGAQITSLVLPATLSSYTYNETWKELNDNGDWEDVKGKKTLRIMGGAFQMLDKLTAFEVEETNTTFFARDGVLYAIVEDGYVLVQYPAGKTDTEYRVLDGTVRIADSAFYQDKHLKKVTLPMSVKSVGAFAFYGSAVEEYVFEAVEAPILETSCILLDFTYISDQTSEECWVFSPFVGFQSTLYYANFGGFAGLIIEEEHYLSHLGRLEDNGANVDEYKNYTAPVFTHKLYRPENGQGYTSPIWLAYFSEANTTLTAYSADRTTQNAIDKITAISTADEIQTTINALSTSEEKLAKLNEISTQSLAGARKAYNEITDDKQKALVTEYDKLLASEGMVRELKAQAGSPVEVDRLERKGTYKTRYTAGEKFNPEGMTITAVFTDGSLIVITPEDYVLDKSGALNVGDESVTLSYGGKSLELAVQVSGNTPDDSDTDSDSTSTVKPTPSKGNGSGGTIALVIVLVCLVGAAAAAVVVVMKKKGKNNK